MKAIHLVASTCITLALLSGCSRDEPATPPVTTPETTGELPQQNPSTQPRNDLDLPQNPTSEDALEPAENPYSPTTDPYAPTENEGESRGDGVSPPADDNLPE